MVIGGIFRYWSSVVWSPVVVFGGVLVGLQYWSSTVVFGGVLAVFGTGLQWCGLRQWSSEVVFGGVLAVFCCVAFSIGLAVFGDVSGLSLSPPIPDSPHPPPSGWGRPPPGWRVMKPCIFSTVALLSQPPR